MNNIKNRMYNYEVTPPKEVWESISTNLYTDEATVIPITKKRNTTFYYTAAASVSIILFCLIFFTNRLSKSGEEISNSSDDKNSSSSKIQNGTAMENNSHLIMTVPIEDKTAVNHKDADQSLAQNQSQKGGPNQKQNKEIIKNDDADNTASTYIIIEGPEGQPVKVSSKMATLIDSSETKESSRPVWNKKINEWREIMKVNTLGPTTGNFLDIVELTKAVKD